MDTSTRIGCVLLTLVLVGCATPVGPMTPPPAPESPQTSANMRVYRATRPADDLLRMVFTINGNATYVLRPGQRYDFQLGAGSYQLGYQMAGDNCAQEVQIDRGGNYVFKLGSGCNIELEGQ
jgi:hypothetical protein